jgi:hypothetical protein
MVVKRYHRSMKKQRKATTLRLEEKDIKALEQIKSYYGIASDNQAIVLALQLLVKQLEKGEGAPSSAG